MIKTTFTRIKRVCAIALVPRILRGELRLTPGKFEKFSAAYALQKSVSKSTKSSKSSDKKHRRKAPEDPQKYGVSTVCENSIKPEFFDAVTITRYRKRKPKTDIPRKESPDVVTDSIYKEKPACRCDKCNELEDDIPSNIKLCGVPPLYNPTPACRCDDCHRVIADIFGEPATTSMQYERNIPNDYHGNITQCSILGDSGSDKLITEPRIQPGASYNIPDPEKPKTNIKNENTSEEDNSLIKDLRTGSRNDLILMNENDKKLNTTGYTSLYDVPPEENKPNLILDPKDTTVSNREGHETFYCEPNLDIDQETLNIYKSLKAKNTNFEDTEAGKINKKYEPKPSNNYETDIVLHATTYKQDEEKLVQKLEHIEEVQINEAEKSKIDNTNVTPKILGNIEKAVNFADNAIDEVAKRCLNSKHKQVDEILLREMEKLGIPITGQKSSTGIKDNENVHSNGIYNSKISDTKQEYRSETNKPANELTGQYTYDLNKTQIANDHLTNMSPETFHTTISNRNRKLFISPRHKRRGRQPGTPTEITSTQLNNKLNEETWGNHLDSKHVLTCNETCPISPKPITDSIFSRHEDTQSIYENNYTIAKDEIKQEPLLECEESYENRESAAMKVSDLKNKKYELNECTNISQNELNILNTQLPPKFQVSNITPANASEIILSKESSAPSDSGSIAKTEKKEKSIPNEDCSIKDNNIAIDSAKNEENVGYTNSENKHYYEIGNDLERIEYASEQLQATSEQLQSTSGQLLAASDQLQETSEKLHNATQLLQNTSEKLKCKFVADDVNEHIKETSVKLRSAGEKFESCTEDLESTTEKLQNMCNNFEQIILTHLGQSADRTTNAPTHTINPSIIPSVASNIVASKDSTNTRTSTQLPLKTKCDESLKDKAKLPSATTSCGISLAQPSATLNPNSAISDHLPITPLGPLPEVNDRIKLSELMKIVKERNRIIENCHYLMSRGKKSIPPLSMPMQNAPVRVTPGYPELKPKPRVCNPKRSKPKIKCSQFDPKILGIDQDSRSSSYHEVTSPGPNQMDNVFCQGVAITADLAPSLNFKDEMALQLKSLSNVLESSYQQKKMEALEAVMLLRSRKSHRSKLFKAKDFEPWTPIPSWPHTKQKKQGRPKLQCPKDGCKSFPPTRSEHDPPCGLWPCDSFPTFPKRKFSKLDYYTVLLTRNKIINLVENEDSPTLSRSFFKTEWTKPKYTDKPYTTARKNKEHLKIPTPKEKPMISSKNSNTKNNTNNFSQKIKIPDRKKSNPAQILNLNLERLLLPTMASVSYVIYKQ